MTKFEQIKPETIEEMVELLDKYGVYDNAPWTMWFDKEYCRKCEDVLCRYEDGAREFGCAWCELYDRCRFFPGQSSTPDNKQIIRMWLESEAV